MAKFMRVHMDGDEERIVNMEQITTVDETGKTIYTSDGDWFMINRQCDWEKIVSFVNQNEV